MGHPTIDEFCRAKDFQPHFLRRCQREFREQVQPQLDRLEAVEAENTSLKAQLARLQERATRCRDEAVPA